MTHTYQHPARIIVTASTSSEMAAAQSLAAEFNLPYTPNLAEASNQAYDFLLIRTPDYLGLQSANDKKLSPFYLDFVSGKMRYRSDQAGLKNELLARSLGVKPNDHPVIVDATAGLGRDSFILASLGFTITALESHPVIFALLRDAIRRASHVDIMKEIASHIHLVHTDARRWLSELSPSSRPDIIYLDPMFPAREKSASVKKEMVILQNLLGKVANDQELLDIALTCGKLRVVVKRPRLAPALSERKPNYSLTGKSSRFDIYLVEQ